MAEKPSRFPDWAVNEIISAETGIQNRLEPPSSKKNVGFNFGEPVARQFINDLHYMTSRWLRYFDSLRNTSDGNGAQIFNIENSLVTLYAVNTEDPAEYLQAMGYRGAGAAVLNVVDFNVLTLGASDTDGSQVISGADAADIMLLAIMQPRNNN